MVLAHKCLCRRRNTVLVVGAVISNLFVVVARCASIVSYQVSSALLASEIRMVDTSKR